MGSTKKASGLTTMTKMLLPIILTWTLLLLIVNIRAEKSDLEEHKVDIEHVERKEIIGQKVKREPKKDLKKNMGEKEKVSKQKFQKKNKGNKVRQNFPKKKRSFKKKSSQRKAKKIKRKKKSKQKQISTKKLKLKQKKKSKKVKPQRSKKQMKNPRMKESCSRQSTFCPVEKATSLKLLYNQVYNFKKQLKRAQNQAKIVQKKKLKNNIFTKDALILTDILGGNLTDPTCSATAATKRSASQASSAGSTLAACSASITTSCQDITINATLTGSCSATMTAYEKKIAECRSSGCSCWTEAVAMKSDVTRCNAVTESDTVKTKKKTCLKTFSGCKKAQDSAVEYTATCPASVTSTSTTSTSSPSTATTE